MNFGYALIKMAKHKLNIKTDCKIGEILLETSYSNIGNIKRGERKLTQEQVLKIAQVLEVEPGELLVRNMIEKQKTQTIKDALEVFLENRGLTKFKMVNE